MELGANYLPEHEMQDQKNRPGSTRVFPSEHPVGEVQVSVLPAELDGFRAVKVLLGEGAHFPRQVFHCCRKSSSSRNVPFTRASVNDAHFRPTSDVKLFSRAARLL